MNVEPVDVDHDAKNRLHRTDDQQRDVVAASPETPAQGRDDGARHESQEYKTLDVILVSDVVAPDRTRGQLMPGQAIAEKYYADPNPAALYCSCVRVCARQFHNGSVGFSG